LFCTAHSRWLHEAKYLVSNCENANMGGKKNLAPSPPVTRSLEIPADTPSRLGGGGGHGGAAALLWPGRSERRTNPAESSPDAAQVGGNGGGAGNGEGGGAAPVAVAGAVLDPRLPPAGAGGAVRGPLPPLGVPHRRRAAPASPASAARHAPSLSDSLPLPCDAGWGRASGLRRVDGWPAAA
jgi:hypothetical protein